MSSLAMMLAGGPIGMGAGQFGHQFQQGQTDRQAFDQREAVNTFQNNQMNQDTKEQAILNGPAVGDTDAEKVRYMANVLEGSGSTQKAIALRSKADAMDQDAMHQRISAASDATLRGGKQAIDLWNKSGAYEGEHVTDIQPKRAEDGSLDSTGNFIFSVRNPDTGQIHPLEVPRELMIAGVSDPKQIPLVLQRAQQMGQNYALKDRGLDQKDAQIAETERYHRASIDEKTKRDQMMMAWKRSGGGSGKLPNQQWMAAWAQKPVAEGGGGMTPQAAMAWAADPNRSQREYQQSLRLGTTIAGSGGGFTADDVSKIAAAIRGTPIGKQNTTETPPTPSGAVSPEGMRVRLPDGSVQVKRNGVWVKE